MQVRVAVTISAIALSLTLAARPVHAQSGSRHPLQEQLDQIRESVAEILKGLPGAMSEVAPPWTGGCTDQAPCTPRLVRRDTERCVWIVGGGIVAQLGYSAVLEDGTCAPVGSPPLPWDRRRPTVVDTYCASTFGNSRVIAGGVPGTPCRFPTPWGLAYGTVRLVQ